MGGWFRSRGNRQEALNVGVALERPGERRATLGAELVAAEPVRTRQRKGDTRSVPLVQGPA